MTVKIKMTYQKKKLAFNKLIYNEYNAYKNCNYYLHIAFKIFILHKI